MNIVFDISNFQLGYMYFLHAKQNIVMDGIFSKIIYSNEFMTLNGIFLYIPLDVSSVEKIMNKNVVKFSPSSQNNISLIQELSKIENRIIEYYKQTHQNNRHIKRTSCLLSKQLYSGNLKLYRDYSEDRTNRDRIPHYVIKISGIWENNDEIGITYKTLETF